MTKLTATACKNAKPYDDGKPKKYADGGGLYLLVTTSGKYWRVDYRFQGKRLTAALGAFPAISLADARAAHALLKQQLAQGIDPNAEKKAAKAAIKEQQQEADGTSLYLFANIAADWVETTAKAKSWSEATRANIERNLKNYVLPAFASSRIDAITSPAIVAHLRSIESAQQAAYTLENIKRIFRHAFNLQRIDYSPAELLKAGEILPAHQSKPMRHTLDPMLIGKALLAIERSTSRLPSTRNFLRLLPYCFTRQSELREAKWEELDGDRIIIPAERMKKRRDFVVPLARQAQAIIEAMRIHTAHTPYIFTGEKLQPISATAVYKIMRQTKIDERQSLKDLTTLHGFRHTASTLLHEKGYDSMHIEAHLAHQDTNKTRAIYNSAKYFEQRLQMAQDWADYLDELKAQALVMESK